MQGLPLSESNYQRAVDLLKERFGQKQVLINAHMDALIKIPSATNDVKKLRSLYDVCEDTHMDWKRYAFIRNLMETCSFPS